MPQRTTSRAAAAAVAIALTAGLSAGSLVLAVPASAAGNAPSALSPAQAQKRQLIDAVFKELNRFRASEGLKPVRLGLDATELLEAMVADWSSDLNSPDSIQWNKRIRGYTRMELGSAFVNNAAEWANNRLLAEPQTNVVGIAAGTDGVLSTTVYAYPTLPAQTFDSADAYFAYLDLPQLTGPAPKITGTAAWGNKLTADPGVWPAGTKLSYRWFQTNSYGYTYFADDNYSGEATRSSYLIGDNEANKNLSVQVTAILPGQRAAVMYSAPTALIKPAETVINSKPPAMTGTFEAGQTVSVDPGAWEPGTTLSYQWVGGSASTSRTMALTKAGEVRVQVTGSKPGKRSRTITVDARTVIDINTAIPRQIFGDIFKPREGAPAVGEEFHAWFTGEWQSGTTLTQQWTRNRKPIPGATGSSYKLTTADVGATIALSVTGTRAGNKPRTVFAEPSEKIVAPRPPVVNTKLPTISGTGLVGKTLTANPGTWTPGTRFTYQWTIRRGVSTYPIAGATSNTYTPRAADDGGIVSVNVTGWKDGYSPFMIGGLGGGNPPSVEVHKALVATPRITGPAFQTDSGSVFQGQTLTAEAWKSGAALGFQWKRNGVVIPGATNPTYKTGNGDAGKKISVTVTGRLAGFPTASATSVATTPVMQLQTQYFGLPSVSWGNGRMPVVGETVRVLSVGKWTPGAKFTYQWKRNGAAIKGATGSSYKAASADVNKMLSVSVTGQTPDYLPVTFDSLPTPVRASAPRPPGPPPMYPGHR